MSWASQRRALYFLGTLIVVGLLVGVPAYLIFYDPPTCTDGERNGQEEGVDCGGGCPIVCSFSAAEPLIHWQRLFPVIPGVYATVALVENPNASFRAFDVPYVFKLRGSDGVLVYEEKGRMYLPPKSVVPVFATGLRSEERVPTRVEFALGRPTWVRGTPDDPVLDITEQKLETPASQPKVTAIAKNEETYAVGKFAAVAILYDAEGNAVNASRTIIDGIEAFGETPLIFTWPMPLGASVAKIDIIPVFAPPASR